MDNKSGVNPRSFKKFVYCATLVILKYLSKNASRVQQLRATPLCITGVLYAGLETDKNATFRRTPSLKSSDDLT